jgi:hypothetical protein
VPLVPNGLVVKLVDRGFCEGQEIINDTHWRIAGGGEWDAVAMDELADQYINWWSEYIQPVVMAGYVKSEVVVTQQLVDGLQRIYTGGLPLSGLQVGDGLPLNVAACVTLSTGRAGRAGRGRFYLGALAENNAAGSRFTAGFVNQINTAFSALRQLGSESTLNVYELVVYSTVLGGNPRVTGLASAVDSAYLRDNVVDSQRRRLPGRGR